MVCRKAGWPNDEPYLQVQWATLVLGSPPQGGVWCQGHPVGIEHTIDVNELAISDIALLEPGEIIPHYGAFISCHNDRCDESGATGESDAIKNIGYEDCIKLREQAKHEGVDTHRFDDLIPTPTVSCFPAPRSSKVMASTPLSPSVR